MKVPLIAIDPSISEEVPTIVRSRVRVTDVLRWLAEGKTIKRISKEHSDVSEDGARAAVEYAILALEHRTDEPFRHLLLDILFQRGFGWDTEDRAPGPPSPPDMSVAMGYAGRVQTSK